MGKSWSPKLNYVHEYLSDLGFQIERLVNKMS